MLNTTHFACGVIAKVIQRGLNSKVDLRLTQNRKLKTKRRYLRHTVIQSSCSSLYRLPIAPVGEKRKKEMKQKRSSHKVVDVHPFVTRQNGKRTKRRRWAGV